MDTSIRQNFILPKNVKNMLDTAVAKGEQSAFVAQTIEMRLKAKKSWQILEVSPRLNIKNPLGYAKKIRNQLDKA